MTLVFFVLVMALSLSMLGCSCESGPQRYQLSGKVLHDGKPVPVGEVSLQPDSSQGNSGPACIALIKEGHYKTEADKGIVGGPYLVRIAGFDGVPVGDSTQGREMFPSYETKVDLPKETSTHDFEVPARSQRTREER
jgi:hypothetical protein